MFLQRVWILAVDAKDFEIFDSPKVAAIQTLPRSPYVKRIISVVDARKLEIRIDSVRGLNLMLSAEGEE